MPLELCPLTIRQAKAWVDEHHRHHRAPQGGLFALGLQLDGLVIGCAIVGRPVARLLDDHYTAEVTRLCTDGTPHACSKLYAACWRACRAIGYRKLITYTLASEGGASLRAAGMKVVAQTRGGSWSRSERPRIDSHPLERKLRWELSA